MTEFFNRSSEKDLRRRLRKELTPAEAELWSRLRRGQLRGHRFRRQYSIGPYCVDFYCVQAKLAIELDGDSHYTPEAKHYDAERQRYIGAFGVRFLRFTNAEVHDNLDGVVEAIGRALGLDDGEGAKLKSEPKFWGSGEPEPPWIPPS